MQYIDFCYNNINDETNNNINEKIESTIAKTDEKIGSPMLESADPTNLKDESVSTILENFMNNQWKRIKWRPKCNV